MLKLDQIGKIYVRLAFQTVSTYLPTNILYVCVCTVLLKIDLYTTRAGEFKVSISKRENTQISSYVCMIIQQIY